VSGIGAHVESQSGAILIVAPIPGSPAEKADLRSGDQILSVDGVSVTGLPLDEAVNRIRGEKGSSVKLTIRRGNREFDVIIVRDTVTVPEIDLQWQDTTAVIRLAQFGELTNEKIREVFKQVNERHPQGIILDLRNNPGGLLQAADELMSAFMPKGTVVAIVRGRNGESKELTSEEPVVDKDIKMAVLVNAGSASASEIVAGALQDYKRATIIGTQSFGKGTVQELVNFQGGEALKLTIAEWSTPLDRTINGVGVAPDIVVEPDDTDSQLRRALQILR
jgi:carboxyl-terminal processing protease